MLKLKVRIAEWEAKSQPPSGGCVLKLMYKLNKQDAIAQPPSGGCVLKQPIKGGRLFRRGQPPSGGCVLKLCRVSTNHYLSLPAAFRRLCVETIYSQDAAHEINPAAFRRLCVETVHTF